MSSTAKEKSTQQTQIMSEYKPLIAQHVANTQNLLDNGLKTAELTDLQKGALNTAGTIDQSGLFAASDLNNRAIAGEFLGPNQYIDPVLNRSLAKMGDAYGTATNDIESNAARQGIFGGSAMQQQTDQAQKNLAEQMSAATNEAYLANYQNERANQINAGSNAGALFNNTIDAQNSLFSLGSLEQQYNQAVADGDLRKQQALMEAINVGYQGGVTNTESTKKTPALTNALAIGSMVYGGYKSGK